LITKKQLNALITESKINIEFTLFFEEIYMTNEGKKQQGGQSSDDMPSSS